MSRPAVVYLVMVVTLVGGLWAVLAIGRHLSAPADIAGRWTLTPMAPGPTQTLNVEQSGRFFQIAFEHGSQLNLKLGSDPLSENISLQDRSHQLLIMSSANKDDADTRIFVMTGPDAGSWNAHRMVRTFPADVQSEGVR